MKKPIDFYTKQRIKHNLLSRAYFKLEEIDKKYQLIKQDTSILELGAAPGGWTQYIRKKTKKIVAVDLLPLKITGIEFYQEDIFKFQPKGKFDLILSDMAPNLSGNWEVDTIRMENLIDCIFQKYINHLKPEGSIVIKIFNNQPYFKQHYSLFKKYKFLKPKASKPKSREIYFIGINFCKKTVSNIDLKGNVMLN